MMISGSQESFIGLLKYIITLSVFISTKISAVKLSAHSHKLVNDITDTNSAQGYLLCFVSDSDVNEKF